MTDPIAALAKALHTLTLDENDEGYDADVGWYYPGSRDDLAAALLAALPPGWCGCDLTTAHMVGEQRGRDAARAEIARLRHALEGMVHQFACWDPLAGGLYTAGLTALEQAFAALGWDSPRPAPERRCDEPGCMQEGTMGWPTRPGGTGLNGGYRRTCWDHSDRCAELEAER